MNLDKFNHSDNLHNASLDFFINTLNIKITAFDSKPIAVADFFKDPKKLATVAVQNIAQLYIIGLVDDKTLNSQKSDIATVADASKISKDYNGLILAAISLKNTPTRSQLAELTRLVNRSFPYLPVTIIFKYDNKISFANAERITYIQPWREGEKFGKISMLKDIDIEKPHAAHLRILLDLKTNNKIDTFDSLYNHWQKVLNTKELNKQFFKKIANWYFWSVAKSKFPYEYLKLDPKHQTKTNAELQDLANQKATIRFITRIIFVWFLKEKNLIPNQFFDKDFIDTILKKDSTKKAGNYFNAILQNLFFATLNRTAATRAFALDKGFHKNKEQFDVNSLYRYENLFVDEDSNQIMKLFQNIPFLNGGLFDSLDRKATKTDDFETEIIDGFSRNEKWQAYMPNYLFFEHEKIDFNAELNAIYQTKKGNYELKGLFAIFDEYKFTIEENTPLEVDVALDPYLLGEIFENLLAYYNPETGATARKGSGSFYTPQEIVNYMVDQSLLAYLKTHLPDLEWENFEQLPQLSAKDARIVVAKLCDIKILDPACGSGAFPMGVLYKMVSILNTIDADNKLLKQIQHDKIIGDKIAELESDKKAIEGLSDQQVKTKASKAVEDRLAELETIFNNDYNFDDYARKLFIIQNCIYGVDIQDVAIQISKLRFFLSLIIDQKNDDIRPLPNLETKFVIANTLIGVELPQLQLLGEDDHSQDQTKELKEQLKAVRQNYFKATTRTEKNKLKIQDRDIREKIANSLADSISKFKQADVDIINVEIEKQKQIIAEAELMPDMIQEIIVKDLFGGQSTQKVNYRKERIKEALASIRLAQSKIDSLQTNTKAEIIRQQALKIAEWDIYNQNASAEWFDMDWMFGITDGFDVVIGNPPYVVFNGKMKEAISEILKFEIYDKCKGGKLNAFELFLAKTDEILKNKGICCQIFQNSFLGDNSAKGVRQFYIENNKILKIDSFPERDDPNKRVFESVKMSVCVFTSKKLNLENYNFELIIHKDKTLSNFDKVNYSKDEIKELDAENYVIPTLLQDDKKVFIKYNSHKIKYLELYPPQIK